MVDETAAERVGNHDDREDISMDGSDHDNDDNDERRDDGAPPSAAEMPSGTSHRKPAPESPSWPPHDPHAREPIVAATAVTPESQDGHGSGQSELTRAAPPPVSAEEKADGTPVNESAVNLRHEERWPRAFAVQADDTWLQEPSEWRAAPEELPPEWIEAERARGPEFDEKREEALRFASRRRRESESQATLAEEPLPAAPPPPDEPAKAPRPRQELHHETPQGTIWRSMLYSDAVAGTNRLGALEWTSRTVDEIDEWLSEAAAAVKALEVIDDADRAVSAMALRLDEATTAGKPLLKARLETLRATRRGLPKPRPPERVIEVGQDRLARWARGRIWKVDEQGRCTLEQPSTPDDPPPCEVKRSFFSEWAAKLGWTDREMLYGVAAGVDSHAACELTTVLRFHHKGLQRNFGPARDSIEDDSRPDRQWITRGTVGLPYVPMRLVARNVAEQLKWKRAGDGTLQRAIKYRVTTDDSAEDDALSRNNALPREEWVGPFLPEVGRLARAVAVLRAWIPAETAVSVAHSLLESGISDEQVVLWAIDLSDAYRKLAVQRMERWLQGFVWSDGCRTDHRAVFGTASMVQFFSRVSLFLQAVTRVEINEWGATRPMSEARKAWAERKGSPTYFLDMYIDVSRARGEHAHTRTEHRLARQIGRALLTPEFPGPTEAAVALVVLPDAPSTPPRSASIGTFSRSYPPLAPTDRTSSERRRARRASPSAGAQTRPTTSSTPRPRRRRLRAMSGSPNRWRSPPGGRSRTPRCNSARQSSLLGSWSRHTARGASHAPSSNGRASESSSPSRPTPAPRASSRRWSSDSPDGSSTLRQSSSRGAPTSSHSTG